MISELNIKTYRGIHNLELNNLGMVNIIAGANNTGKTSILEVIESLSAPNNIRNWRMIGRRDGNSPRTITTIYDTMKALFPMEVDDEKMIISYFGDINGSKFNVEIRGNEYDTIISEKQLNSLSGIVRHDDEDDIVDKEYETKALEIKYCVNDKICGKDMLFGVQRGISYEKERDDVVLVRNIQYISPVQHAQNVLFLNALMTDPELYEQFVDIMKEFDPGFISVNAVADDRTMGRKYIVLSKNHKEGLLLNAYGDGMKKAMLLLSAVLMAKDGVLLLDEFETAIHISAMEKIFKQLILVAKRLNVQIFMTSHSLEAIETVLKCCPDMQNDIRMITLVKNGNNIKARNVDAKKAVQLLDEYGLELR